MLLLFNGSFPWLQSRSLWDSCSWLFSYFTSGPWSKTISLKEKLCIVQFGNELVLLASTLLLALRTLGDFQILAELNLHRLQPAFVCHLTVQLDDWRGLKRWSSFHILCQKKHQQGGFHSVFPVMFTHLSNSLCNVLWNLDFHRISWI